jgi:hypothetical protein
MQDFLSDVDRQISEDLDVIPVIAKFRQSGKTKQLTLLTSPIIINAEIYVRRFFCPSFSNGAVEDDKSYILISPERPEPFKCMPDKILRCTHSKSFLSIGGISSALAFPHMSSLWECRKKTTFIRIRGGAGVTRHGWMMGGRRISSWERNLLSIPGIISFSRKTAHISGFM